MSERKRKVYGYARASTEEQVDTLKVQEEQILREYEFRYKPQGMEWGGMYIDAGVSGGKALANRPRGLALCMVVEPHDQIIITKLDRGFRNARNFLEQSDIWRERKVGLRMLDLDVDTSTPIGQLLAGILAHVAEFERNRTSQRCLEVVARRRRENLPYNHPPYGFRCVGKKGQKEYRPNPTQRAVGQQIVRWRQMGWSRDVIYIHLISNRIKRQDGSEYSEGSINKYYRAELALQAREAAGLPGPVPRPDPKQKEVRS